MILLILAVVVTMWAQFKVQGTYSRYEKVKNETGLTGKDIALDILKQKGYSDVQVQISKNGILSDNFDPRSNIVNLSPAVYNGDSIAAAAIAAHECGHVIQHETKYAGIGIRNAVLPLAIIAGNFSWGVIFLGFFLGFMQLFYLGIILLLVVALFQLITLPIEFDASKRALELLPAAGYVHPQQVSQAKQVLSAAALTYVAALLSTILTVLRLFLMSRGRRN